MVNNIISIKKPIKIVIILIVVVALVFILPHIFIETHGSAIFEPFGCISNLISCDNQQFFMNNYGQITLNFKILENFSFYNAEIACVTGNVTNATMYSNMGMIAENQSVNASDLQCYNKDGKAFNVSQTEFRNCPKRSFQSFVYSGDLWIEYTKNPEKISPSNPLITENSGNIFVTTFQLRC
jgi:hypothetical protein